jgi:nitrogen regulatory protein P-II 1
MMKLIKAYVRTYMVAQVLDALKSVKPLRATVLDVKALGDEVSHEQLEISAELGNTYTTMAKIELVCSADLAEKIRDTIVEKARTGYKGDGLVAISPIEEAVSIRTGEKTLEG